MIQEIRRHVKYRCLYDLKVSHCDFKFEFYRVQKQERQQSLQHQDSNETRFSTSPSSSPAPIYSIQARLEANKQTPKAVRILGVEVDIASNQTPPTILEVPEEQSDHELQDEDNTEVTKKRQRLRRLGKRGVDFNLRNEEDEEDEGEKQSSKMTGESSTASLNRLTKEEIIKLWKSSEIQLKEQLRSLMEEKDALSQKLEELKITKPP